MAAGKVLRYAIIGFSVFLLVSLHILSAASFRFKLAGYYKGRHQYDKAAQVYNRILRKNLVKPGLSAETFARVNFELGYLYAGLDLKNPAVEAYTRGGAKFPAADLKEYYIGTDPAYDKLPAIGLLEAGRFESAGKEFRGLSGLYPGFRDAARYMDAAAGLERRKIIPGSENFYFDIGDSYVEKGLFNEARAFFTRRILDYGVSPLDALRYLNKKYSGDAEIISKVWDGNIYVILEDFEDIDTQLIRYSSNAVSKVNKHYIIKESAREGGRSEFLELAYSKKGYDYWSKDVRIPLDAPDLDLGVRIFIKSDNPSRQVPLFWIAYEGKPGLTGICNPPYVRQDLGNGWEEWRVDGLVESAGALGVKNNWNLNGMTVEKVIIDMQGNPGKFYFDGIELFLKR